MGTQLLASPPQKSAEHLSPTFGPCLLWPNGWMDQDGTWHRGGLWSRPHCARWGPSSPPKKGHSPQFSAHSYCGQTAAWIKIPLGTKVGLGLRDTATPRKRAYPAPPNFQPMSILWRNSWMDQDVTWYGGKRRPMRRCVRGGLQLPLKGAQPPPVFGSCVLWPNGCMDEDATW